MKHGVKWDPGSPLGRASRPRRPLPRIGGLGGRTKAPARGTDKEKPPRRNPGGQKEANRGASVFERVAALRVLGLRGGDRPPHLLPQGAGQEPTNRVRLPAGGFHEFLQGGAAGVLQQVEYLGGLAALAGAGCLLGRLGRPRAFGSPLRRAGLPARPSVVRRNVSLLCGGPRLFGRLWLLGRGSGLGVGGFCWNAVHIVFSFVGDYRDPMDHSGSSQLPPNSDPNPPRRVVGRRPSRPPT